MSDAYDRTLEKRAKLRQHRTTIEHLGGERWRAKCACGWVGETRESDINQVENDETDHIVAILHTESV